MKIGRFQVKDKQKRFTSMFAGINCVHSRQGTNVKKIYHNANLSFLLIFCPPSL